MVLSMERWLGKVAVVTGASSGIGAAITKKLVQEGLQVVGIARREEKLQTLATELQNQPGKFYPHKTDISKENEILDAFKWIQDNVGPVHILINNAGVSLPTTLYDGDSTVWRKIFEGNVFGLCVATREAVRIMMKNGVDGHVIHMNSINGHQVSVLPQSNVYSASKFAVTALTETLRKELVGLGSKIKVTSISPGCVDTEIFELAGHKKILDDMKEQGRCLECEDIADAVLYVLSTPPHVQIHELTIKPVGELV